MATLVEDFEDTTFVWANVTGNWSRSNATAHSGSWSYRSATIGNNQTSSAVVTPPPGATAVQFWYRVSSEENFDWFEFLIGGSVELEESGEIGWTQSPTFPLGGASTITFRYVKDESAQGGSDAAWIDDVTFTVPDPVLRRGPATWPSAAARLRSHHW